MRSRGLASLKNAHESSSHVLEIRNAAAVKLRDTLIAKVSASETKRVPLSALSPSDNIAFANVLMADYITALDQLLTSPIPKPIVNYSRAWISCHQQTARGEPGVEYEFYAPPDSGNTFSSTGFSLWVHDPITLPPPALP